MIICRFTDFYYLLIFSETLFISFAKYYLPTRFKLFFANIIYAYLRPLWFANYLCFLSLVIVYYNFSIISCCLKLLLFAIITSTFIFVFCISSNLLLCFPCLPWMCPLSFYDFPLFPFLLTLCWHAPAYWVVHWKLLSKVLSTLDT
jgi:hypothetical protein